MKKLLNFLFWPALAGVVFAVTLLQAPQLSRYFPALDPAQNQFNEQVSLVLPSFSDAIRNAAPAVVRINFQEQVFTGDDQVLRPGRLPETIKNEFYKSNNLGSGVIISPEGYIITSYHIFPPLDNFRVDPKLTVTLSDSRTYEARQLIADEENDLALLKIDADNLSFITPVEDNLLRVGDIVLAIGNPRNIGQSVSMGIISALLRRDDSYVIQTDAAINPGNSGGALIDINGNLIGINSTIVSESGGSEGIGFSTPAETAMALLESYIESGPGGYLGVEDTRLISPSMGFKTPFGVPLQGILIVDVVNDSPAKKAGLKAGDIITAINSKNLVIRNEYDLLENIAMISSYGSGATINFTIYRDSDFQELAVTLGVGEPTVSYSLESD